MQTELNILKYLNFDIHITSQFRFLERYFILMDSKSTERNFAKFLLESCLVNYKMLKHKPSVLAASTLYLVNKLCYRKDPWGADMEIVPKIDE